MDWVLILAQTGGGGAPQAPSGPQALFLQLLLPMSLVLGIFLLLFRRRN